MLSQLAPPSRLDLNLNSLQVPPGPPSPSLSTTSFMSSVSWMADKTTSELIPLLKNAYSALKDKEKGSCSFIFSCENQQSPPLIYNIN